MWTLAGSSHAGVVRVRSVATGCGAFDVFPRTQIETSYSIACAILGLFGMSLLIGGATTSKMHTAVKVAPNPVKSLTITYSHQRARTGDVVSFGAILGDAEGKDVDSVPVAFSMQATPDDTLGNAATGQITPDGRFVAEKPGMYAITASVGAASDTFMLRCDERFEQKRKLVKVGHGPVLDVHTSDPWVWAGGEGRGARAGRVIASGAGRLAAAHRVPTVLLVERERPRHFAVVLVLLDEHLDHEERAVLGHLKLEEVEEPRLARCRRPARDRRRPRGAGPRHLPGRGLPRDGACRSDHGAARRVLSAASRRRGSGALIRLCRCPRRLRDTQQHARRRVGRRGCAVARGNRGRRSCGEVLAEQSENGPTKNHCSAFQFYASPAPP